MIQAPDNVLRQKVTSFMCTIGEQLLVLTGAIFTSHNNVNNLTIHSLFFKPQLCYAAASPLRVPFPIDFICAILKVFLIEDLPS